MKMLYSTVLVCALCVLLTACSTISSYQGGDPRWANFKAWKKINGNEPLTGDPTRVLGRVHKGRSGYRDIYINQIGYSINQGDAPYSYPKGTVVVKEQFADETAWLAQQPTDLTIMVKLAGDGKGDAKNWGFVSGYSGEVSDSAFCLSCHNIAKSKDFIFTNKELLVH